MKYQGDRIIFNDSTELSSAADIDETLRNDLSETNGSSFIGWIRGTVGAVSTTISKWIARQNGSLYDFMTDAQISDTKLENPTLDHTEAILKWLSTANDKNAIYLPAGQFRFSQPLNSPVVKHLKIYGEGRRKSVLKYVGQNTTNDLLTIGDGNTPMKPFLTGFSIESSTKMTAGTAIRLRKCTNGFSIKDVCTGTPAGEYMLWDGVWFDNTNVGFYEEFEIGVQSEGIIATGSATTDEGSDLFLDKGLILAGTNQIHMAGGFGGLTIGQVLCYGGKVNVLVSTTRVNRGNREVLLSSRCVLDAASDALLRIDDNSGQLVVNCDAWLSGGGFFTASPGYGIDIVKMNGGSIMIGSGAIKGSKSHGVNIQDSTANVYISDKTLIAYNGGWGVHSPVYTQNCKIEAQFSNNTVGNIAGFVDAYRQAGQGVAASSGTLGNYSAFVRYQLRGGVCDVYAETTITTNGDASGALIFATPFPIKKNVVGYGYCSGVSGKQVYVRGDAGNTAVTVQNYDGSYPGSSGETVRIHYSYEIQY